MRSLTRAIFLVTVLIAGCGIVDEITPRNYVGLVVAYTTPLKKEIAKSLIMNSLEAVPQAGALQLPHPEKLVPLKFDFGWVTRSGAIVVQSKDYSVIVLQEPTVVQGAVRWSCIVHPTEAKPNLCGSEYQDSLLKDK
ncbi:hypothetical protein GO998_05940 [Ralstonia syzygii]|uniref:Lipoprotein n=1 Tax=Ralstonia syzygii TaxID=28097 RepID=A0ABX7ZD66_9RALS|nr:hypothetical protein [Ralstonia syzygii]QUP53336.1 hypothetical protein GO998_05940 [Ralstonia syzygii]